MISRRRFIRNAATGLFVPSLMSCVVRGSVPLPLGFFKGSSSAVSHHAEATDWVTRVNTNGGSVSDATRACADTFATAIDAVSGLRAKILRVNLFAGTGFAAAQVPFYKDAGGTVDAPMLGSCSAGSGSDWTYVETGSTGGLKQLTAGACLDTGLPLTTFSGDSYAKCSLGVYVKTALNETMVSMGGQDLFNSNAAFMLLAGYVDGNTYFYGFSTAADVHFSDSNGVGFYLGVRTSSTLMTLYKNGTSQATNSSATLVTPIGDLNLHVFAYHTTTACCSTSTTKQFLGYVIGKDYDATQAAGVSSALIGFNTCLSRQV